nr:MAG TPA: hypothetical protein [Caudoviricetes sp.]
MDCNCQKVAAGKRGIKKEKYGVGRRSGGIP